VLSGVEARWGGSIFTSEDSAQPTAYARAASGLPLPFPRRKKQSSGSQKRGADTMCAGAFLSMPWNRLPLISPRKPDAAQRLADPAKAPKRCGEVERAGEQGGRNYLVTGGQKRVKGVLAGKGELHSVSLFEPGATAFSLKKIKKGAAPTCV
jgi:hypothetical protein